MKTIVTKSIVNIYLDARSIIDDKSSWRWIFFLSDLVRWILTLNNMVYLQSVRKAGRPFARDNNGFM